MKLLECNAILSFLIPCILFITNSSNVKATELRVTEKAIEYNLTDTCDVSISILNVYVDEMYKEEHELLPPGQYRLDLDSINIMSGIYFCDIAICDTNLMNRFIYFDDNYTPGQKLDIQRKYDAPRGLSQYLNLLLAEKWDLAAIYWLADEIEKSKRLEIEYDNVPFKYDCSSPLLASLDDIRSGLISYTISESIDSGNYKLTNVNLIYNSDTIMIPYYTVREGTADLIVSPMYVHSQEWHKIDTRFSQVICENNSLVNEFALSSLDRSIISICKKLGTTKGKTKKLQKEKIDYYLCTEEQFEKITGYNAHGIANLQVDAIVSRHLPHPHELTHLLINYTLGELPLYTLPILQEGLAVALGGRWGKTPEVVMQIAPALLKNNICSLDTILTWNGFQNDVGMADITYPIAGIFVNMLIEEFGIKTFKKIYLDLSGSNSEVQSFTKSEIKNVIEKQTGKSWQEIEDRFNNHCPQFEFSGIIPGGSSDSDKAILEINSDKQHLSVYESENSYLFNVRSEDGKPDGVILFADPPVSLESLYKSWMYTEHLPDIEYHDELYGVKFNPDEVGLYNYITNILEAKYIATFSPDGSYWDEKDNVLTFCIDKDVFKKNIDEYEINLVK